MIEYRQVMHWDLFVLLMAENPKQSYDYLVQFVLSRTLPFYILLGVIIVYLSQKVLLLLLQIKSIFLSLLIIWTAWAFPCRASY